MKKYFIKYWKFLVLLLIGLGLVLGVFLFKDELLIISTRVTSPNRHRICEQNDLKSVAREYLNYIEENYFEDGEVVNDPIEVYGNSNILYEDGEISNKYLPFSPSRFINLIYATILSEEYLGLDNTLSTSIKDRYFEITAPFSLINNSDEAAIEDLEYEPLYGEEAIEYIDQRFMEYLSDENIEFDESDPDWHDDRDEVLQEYLDEYGQEIDEYLGDNGLLEESQPVEVDIDEVPQEELDKIEESVVEKEDDSTLYQSQNIFSVCYPLKYSEKFSEETKDIFSQICMDSYDYLYTDDGCTEGGVSEEDFEVVARSFMDDDSSILEEMYLDDETIGIYNTGDLSIDYFILSEYIEDEEESRCIIEAGYRLLGGALSIMKKGFDENGSYNTDGIFQLSSTISYLKGEGFLDGTLSDELLVFLSLDILGNSFYTNSHDSPLMDVFVLESSMAGYEIDSIREEDLITNGEVKTSQVFSDYCENSDLPFVIFEEVSGIVYGSLDTTSRLLFDLILLDDMDD